MVFEKCWEADRGCLASSDPVISLRKVGRTGINGTALGDDDLIPAVTTQYAPGWDDDSIGEA